MVINHEHEMPTDYGTTPGGTMFAHTPGGKNPSIIIIFIHFQNDILEILH